MVNEKPLTQHPDTDPERREPRTTRNVSTDETVYERDQPLNTGKASARNKEVVETDGVNIAQEDQFGLPNVDLEFAAGLKPSRLRGKKLLLMITYVCGTAVGVFLFTRIHTPLLYRLLIAGTYKYPTLSIFSLMARRDEQGVRVSFYHCQSRATPSLPIASLRAVTTRLA